MTIRNTEQKVDPKKWEDAWARKCKQGCKGPWRNGLCIYCGGNKPLGELLKQLQKEGFYDEQ